MSNLVTVNSGSAIDGSLKAGRVAISTDSTITPSSGGKTWYNMINPAEGYVFISDPKVQGYNDGPPIIYPSQTSLPADILATINGLPDRVGSVPFDNVWDALVWVQSTGKYFALDKTLTKYPSDGLKFYFDASEISSYPKSGSIAYDLALTNEGDFTNGPVFDETNDSIYFDGTDDYIDFGDVNDLDFGANSFTVAAIAYLNSADASIDYRNIVSKKVGGGVQSGWVLRRNSNDLLSFFPADGTYREDATEGSASPFDRWLFVMGWFDREAGVSRLYVGNEQKGSNNITGNFNSVSSTATFQIGTWNGATDYYKGNIAKVWAYNKSLSTEELNHLYFGAPIVTDGLVFATDAGNLVSYDKVGSTMYSLTGSHAGTINNATYTSSPYQGYFSFDGADDYIEFPDSDDFTFSDAVATWEAWVRPTGNAGVLEHTIMTKANYSYNTREYQFQVRYSSGIYYFYLGQQNNNTSWKPIGSTTTSVIDPNQWYHVIVTSDGNGNAQMYINGELRDTATGWHTTQANLGAPLCIGATINATNPIQEFVGDIGICRLYKKHFSQADVSQNYFAESPRYKSSRDIPKDDLVLELDAHNPDSYLSGTKWSDLSNRGNNGTLINGPTYLTNRGGVINFDNTDDYVDLPNDLGYEAGSVSVFAWYKIEGNPAGNYHIICGGQEFEMSINVSHTYLRNGVLTSNGRFVSNNGNVSLNDGNYHFYGFTFDGSTKRAYIDGVQVGTQSVTGTLITSFSNRRLGRFGSSGTYYANGNMGYYAVWNKVLSADEIMRQYTTMRPQYSVSLPRTITDSLKLNLDAGDTTSYPRTGTTWYDKSGNGNNATLYNSPTYTIAEGGVFDLDGADDYFIAPASAGGMYNFGTDGTLEMWFRPDSSFTTNHRLLCVTNNASAIDVYIASSGILYLHGNKAYASSNTIPINEWTHLMVTYVGGVVQIYFNGEAQTMAGTQLTGYNITNNNQLFIGQFSGGGSYYFNGKIANAKIYHRGLSPSEVLENYKSTRSRFGTDGIVTSNLQILYDFSNPNSFDNSSTTVTDLQGTLNGALVNGMPFRPYNGGVVAFDGSNDYVDAGNPNYSDYTILMWFKIDTTQTTFSTVGHRTLVGCSNFRFQWDDNNTTQARGPFIDFNGGAGSVSGTTFSPQQWFNQWQQVGVSRTNGTVKLYWNGSLVNTGGITGNNLTDFEIGYDRLSGIGGVDPINRDGGEVQLGHFMVYNDVLTDAEVLQNYTALKNRFGKD